MIEGIQCEVKSHGLFSSREVSALYERHSGWSSHGSAPGTHFCHALPGKEPFWVGTGCSHQRELLRESLHIPSAAEPCAINGSQVLPCTSNPLATSEKGDISHVHFFPKLYVSLMEGIGSVPIMGL